MTLRALDRRSRRSRPAAASARGSSSERSRCSMPGSGRPIVPGLRGPVERQVGAGGRGLGHAPAAAERVAGEALEALPHLDRQRRAAGAADAQRGEVAPLDAGMVGERDPHRRHAGKDGGALASMSREHRVGVEARTQQHLVAVRDLPQQDRRSARRCGTAAARTMTLSAPVAAGPAASIPGVVDRHRRRQVARASASRPSAGRWCRRCIAAARRRRRRRAAPRRCRRHCR